tara:strand:- start:33 stop:1211 length:1179 start_codon:yes stop_codon:yes gene_type:complete
MKESFRWYGPKDSVSLDYIRQAGAKNIVSALHDVPNGSVWKVGQIKDYRNYIKNKGLIWTVVESIPVHEDIKQRVGDFEKYIENYKTTILNLASSGIHTICYNFMPVLDWTRTDLYKPLGDGSTALAYETDALCAFDLFVVKRKNANQDYSLKQIRSAQKYFTDLDQESISILTNSIIAGLPGSEEDYTIEEFNMRIEAYENITKETLRSNLIQFLEAIIPTAESCGIRMCIHPDDPPQPLFGIPRVVSNLDDLNRLFSAVPSLNNGLTFCTGSFGVLAENNLLEMFTKHADRIHFLHLRSTQRDGKGNFFEANHLEGDVDMYTMVKAALIEENRRKSKGRKDFEIPMRPDHGHQMLDDLNKKTNPGYSAIGRLRGLAELRGLAIGIKRNEN